MIDCINIFPLDALAGLHPNANGGLTKLWINKRRTLAITYNNSTSTYLFSAPNGMLILLVSFVKDAPDTKQCCI